MTPLDSPAVQRFDAALDSVAESTRGVPAVDAFFYALSAMGDHGAIWHVLAVGRVVLGAESWRDAAEFSAALGVEAALVNGPVKMVFRRERPTSETRPHHLRTPRTSSFPSGHASAGMFAATVLSRRTRRRWPWYLLGALMGWSRVHVRIHHPSDVVGGAAIGLLLGRLANRILDARDRRPS